MALHIVKDDEDIIRIPGGMPAIVSKEIFEKAQAIMESNKHTAGKYKAKENYLLSGLIFCGKCGSAMHGNTRLGGRNKLRYSTYRCSRRDRTKECDNKEVQYKYIESFVLEQLEKQVFSIEAVPRLLNKLNSYRIERACKETEEYGLVEAKLKDTNTQIDRIVEAIATGTAKTAFTNKLNELDSDRIKLEARLAELDSDNSKKVITEEMLRKVLFAANARFLLGFVLFDIVNTPL